MATLLFSYGTLQLESVQIASFGRILKGHTDAMTGYKLSYIEITDKEVLAKSSHSFIPLQSRRSTSLIQLRELFLR